jgi:hypothetical protein
MIKRPGDVLDFTVDFTLWLSQGDVIDSAEFFMGNTGLILDRSTHNDNLATAWISGGSKKGKQVIVCRIITEGGRTKNQPLQIEVL